MPASSLVSNPTSRSGSFFFGSLARSSPSPTGLTFAAHPHVFAKLVRVCFRDNLFRFILSLPTFQTFYKDTRNRVLVKDSVSLIPYNTIISSRIQVPIAAFACANASDSASARVAAVDRAITAPGLTLSTVQIYASPSW